MYGYIERGIRLFLEVLSAILSRFSPRQKSTWVFISGNGSRFAENPKYLFLRAAKTGSIEPIWAGVSEDVIDMLRADGYKAYHRYSLKGRIALLRAGVAIESHGSQFGELLGGACIVDTHHGNALKYMGDDEKDDSDPSKLKEIKHYAYDLLFKPSYFLVTNQGKPLKTFKRAKNLDRSEIIIGPYPRLDPLVLDDKDFLRGVNNDALKSIRQECRDKTIIFYTPTWRRAFGKKNGEPLTKIKPDFERINNCLSEDEYRLYISAHPREPLEINYAEYEVVERLNTGGDIYPFLQYCDLLITDYSSIFYDYSIADRHMIFYAPDLQKYKATRGLYYDYQDHVPGPVVQTTTDLIKEIEKGNQRKSDFASERKRIQEDFYEGIPSHPSMMTLKKILSLDDVDK